MSRPPIHTPTGARVFAYARGSGTGKRTAKRKTPEADFQKAVVVYLTYALPEPYSFYASAVGVNLGKYKGADMKAMGVRPDWADLTIVNMDTGACRWLELKSAVGNLSPGQRAMATRLGAKWATARTVETVEAALIGWGVTPKVSLEKANRYG